MHGHQQFLLGQDRSSLDTNQMDMKFDWAPTSKNEVHGRPELAHARRTMPPNHYGNIADPRNYNGDSIPSKGLRLEVNRTQTATLLMQFRFGITRLERTRPERARRLFRSRNWAFPPASQPQMIRPFGFSVISNFAGFLAIGKGSQFLDSVGHLVYVGRQRDEDRRAAFLQGGDRLSCQPVVRGVGNDTSRQLRFDRQLHARPRPQPARERSRPLHRQLAAGRQLPAAQAGILPRVLTSNPYFGSLRPGRLESVAQSHAERRAALGRREGAHGAIQSAQLFRLRCGESDCAAGWDCRICAAGCGLSGSTAAPRASSILTGTTSRRGSDSPDAQRQDRGARRLRDLLSALHWRGIGLGFGHQRLSFVYPRTISIRSMA